MVGRRYGGGPPGGEVAFQDPGERFDRIRPVVEGIGEYLAENKLGISFHESAVAALQEYVDQPEVASMSMRDVAEAVSVIAWCSVGKAIMQSVVWSQIPQTREASGVVHRSDIYEVITAAHLPEYPDDPCPMAVHAITKSGVAERVLPDQIYSQLRDLKGKLE